MTWPFHASAWTDLNLPPSAGRTCMRTLAAVYHRFPEDWVAELASKEQKYVKDRCEFNTYVYRRASRGHSTIGRLGQRHKSEK